MKYYLTGIEEDLIRVSIRGFNRVMILWLLRHGPLSGYRIIREIERLTKRNFSSGMIYPFLYDLENMGLIAGMWKRKGRKMIKYYFITEEGNKVLENIRDLLKRTKEIIFDFLGEYGC